MSLLVKKILSHLASSLSLSATDKTQYFVHLSFNFTLQLIKAFRVIPKNYLETLRAQQLLFS